MLYVDSKATQKRVVEAMLSALTLISGLCQCRVGTMSTMLSRPRLRGRRVVTSVCGLPANGGRRALVLCALVVIIALEELVLKHTYHGNMKHRRGDTK